MRSHEVQQSIALVKRAGMPYETVLANAAAHAAFVAAKLLLSGEYDNAARRWAQAFGDLSAEHQEITR